MCVMPFKICYTMSNVLALCVLTMFNVCYARFNVCYIMFNMCNSVFNVCYARFNVVT